MFGIIFHLLLMYVPAKKADAKALGKK